MKSPFLWKGHVQAGYEPYIDLGCVEFVLRPSLDGCGAGSVHTIIMPSEADARATVWLFDGMKCKLFLVPDGGDSMAAKKKPARKAKKASKAAAKKPTKKGGRKRPSYSGL